MCWLQALHVWTCGPAAQTCSTKSPPSSRLASSFTCLHLSLCPHQKRDLAPTLFAMQPTCHPGSILIASTARHVLCSRPVQDLCRQGDLQRAVHQTLAQETPQLGTEINYHPNHHCPWLGPSFISCNWVWSVLPAAQLVRNLRVNARINKSSKKSFPFLGCLTQSLSFIDLISFPVISLSWAKGSQVLQKLIGGSRAEQQMCFSICTLFADNK